MVNVIIDGIWCDKCKEMHPYLFYHEKFDDYELNRKEQWEKSINKHFSNEHIEYVDTLPMKGLKEENTPGKCIICNTLTHFKNLETDHYVCSNECKIKDKN